MKWTSFLVQIYNLPLKSMTRETGMEIGVKIGMVLDVDVLGKGVQWGEFLQVWIRFDATKKLIKGKRVIIEGGESKWVFFRYERLPNFCYRCRMLDHGEKDCWEKMSTTNEGGRGCMQYGAWLRGKPGRCVGKDQGKMEDESRLEFKLGREETAVEREA